MVVNEGGKCSFQDLVPVHLDHLAAHAIIITTLNPFQQLDGNPLLFALHERSHDLGDTLLIKPTGLYAVNVFLVILVNLLFPGFLGDRCIPAISIVDAERFDGCIG